MVTGYDHLLFLFGVVFFLFRLREVVLYVTLFAVGHSITMLTGVFFELPINAHLIDAIIGLSVVYKAFDNLGGFAHFGWQPDLRWAVLIFGFFHGFGLAVKLQDLNLSKEGLLPNILALNVGVEVGQVLALIAILGLLNLLRKNLIWSQCVTATNWLLLTCGFMLIGYQLMGYQLSVS